MSGIKASSSSRIGRTSLESLKCYGIPEWKTHWKRHCIHTSKMLNEYINTYWLVVLFKKYIHCLQEPSCSPKLFSSSSKQELKVWKNLFLFLVLPVMTCCRFKILRVQFYVFQRHLKSRMMIKKLYYCHIKSYKMYIPYSSKLARVKKIYIPKTLNIFGQLS